MIRELVSGILWFAAGYGLMQIVHDLVKWVTKDKKKKEEGN